MSSSKPLRSVPLPTPSPSPPGRTRALPAAAGRSTLLDLVASQREHDVAHARHAAEQVRLLHLAHAVRSAPSASSATSDGLTMLRYSYGVEQEERGQKVVKRVTVIVPDLGAGSAPPKQPPSSSLVFLPPGTTVAPPPLTRRPSLLTRTLRQLDTPTPTPSFLSAAGSSSGTQPPRPPHAQPTHLQRRRPALHLPPSPPEPALSEASSSRIEAWLADQRERLVRLRAEEEDDGEVEMREGREGKRRRRMSLAERRGRAPEPLRLV